MTTNTVWPRQSIDAIIVDLDGTMVDTIGDFVSALQGMLSDLPAPFNAFEVSPAMVHAMVGKGSEHLVHSVLTHIDAVCTQAQGSTLFDAAMEAYRRHYAVSNGRHSTVYPGVMEGLAAWAQAGVPLACVTNKPGVFARDLLEKKGLLPWFGTIVGGDEVPVKKPDPTALLWACQRMHTTAPRTLVVGDSVNDAVAARAAGCPVVLVTYGYNHGNPVHDVDADAYVSSLDALHLA
ncbi:MAG: phosphoglycolate phosphatase [Rhodoferax sp.]|nr:phosphoglycolate phosphatase [Rhodoferax sp.]